MDQLRFEPVSRSGARCWGKSVDKAMASANAFTQPLQES